MSKRKPTVRPAKVCHACGIQGPVPCRATAYCDLLVTSAIQEKRIRALRRALNSLHEQACSSASTRVHAIWEEFLKADSALRRKGRGGRIGGVDKKGRGA